LASESFSQEYLNRAEDCERLVAVAANAEVRRTLLYLATRWRGFAAQAGPGDSVTSGSNCGV